MSQSKPFCYYRNWTCRRGHDFRLEECWQANGYVCLYGYRKPLLAALSAVDEVTLKTEEVTNYAIQMVGNTLGDGWIVDIRLYLLARQGTTQAREDFLVMRRDVRLRSFEELDPLHDKLHQEFLQKVFGHTHEIPLTSP